jgi:outer membrane protein assembly factor BamB
MSGDRVPDLSNVASPPRRDLQYTDIEVGEEIGSGGQAVVYEARVSDEQPPDRIALKEPNTEGTIGPATLETFLQEAETWATVDREERENAYWSDSEHVVGVVDVGEELRWMALEYMDGASLEDKLGSNPDGLPVDESLWIGESVCQGVEIAHKNGIAHLDLKPANVLFRETPGTTWPVPKVGDWGGARSLTERSDTSAAKSVEYSAPEQFDQDRFGNPDVLTDVYQTGALLYETLTGRPPYIGSRVQVVAEATDEELPPPPSEYRNSLPDALDEVVLTALEPDKNDRYRSITHFSEALGRVRREVTEQTSDTGVTRRQPRESGSPSSRDWRMFQGGPRRAGHNTEAAGPQPPVSPRWTVELEHGIWSSPTVVDGSVYIGTYGTTLLGSGPGSLHALDAATGNHRWTTDVGGNVRSSPAVVSGTVYVGSNDGSVWAIDAETGDERWSRPVGDKVLSSPAVVDDTVYVGSNNGWMLGSDDGAVHALAVGSGEERWSVGTEGDVDSSPAVVDGTVYVSSGGGSMYALDAGSGERRWVADIHRGTASSPAVVDGTVYVGNLEGDDLAVLDGFLYAFDAASGETEWTYDTGRVVKASPAVFDETIYVGNKSGRIYALDAATGDRVWSFETGGQVMSSPTVADGTVYVGSNDANLYALDADSGDQRWVYSADSAIKGSPAVVDETVYVGSDDGVVYALGPESRNE